ncbi:MAG: hypothetical protein H6711_32870 [Myxococcales bacterium]|nr:hypothetical protein [Myxococcales bacterium]
MARENKPVKAQHGAVAETEGEAKPSALGWALGWIGVPGLILGGIFVGGVYVGANHPESWVSEAVAWIAGLFG